MGSDGPSPRQNVRAACVGPKVNLHCIPRYEPSGQMLLEEWRDYGREDADLALGPCGDAFDERAACEAAAAAVNNFGAVDAFGRKYPLFLAYCSKSQPFTVF